jgi:hypothetical protein
MSIPLHDYLLWSRYRLSDICWSTVTRGRVEYSRNIALWTIIRVGSPVPGSKYTLHTALLDLRGVYLGTARIILISPLIGTADILTRGSNATDSIKQQTRILFPT